MFSSEIGGVCLETFDDQSFHDGASFLGFPYRAGWWGMLGNIR